MNDQTIPADKVEKIAAEMRVAMRRDENTYSYAEFLDDLSGYIRDLDKLCARARPRPTLADMTPEEREECRWMQADVENRSVRYVIATPYDEDSDTALVSADGEIGWMSPERVTPRPDLPPLPWPGTEKPAPALPEGWRLADHKDHGRVLVVRIDGENAIYATPYKATGIRTRICMTSDLEFADTPTAPDHLAVGTVIESAADPRIAALPLGSILLDRDEEATIKRHGAWTGLGNKPIPSEGSEFGPWTVLHIPKEDDQ